MLALSIFCSKGPLSGAELVTTSTSISFASSLTKARMKATRVSASLRGYEGLRTSALKGHHLLSDKRNLFLGHLRVYGKGDAALAELLANGKTALLQPEIRVARLEVQSHGIMRSGHDALLVEVLEQAVAVPGLDDIEMVDMLVPLILDRRNNFSVKKFIIPGSDLPSRLRPGIQMPQFHVENRSLQRVHAVVGAESVMHVFFPLLPAMVDELRARERERFIFADNRSRIAIRPKIFPRIEAEAADVCHRDPLSMLFRSMRLASVLDDRHFISTNLRNRLHVAALPVEMHGNHRFCFRRNRLLQQLGIHEKAAFLDVDELHCRPALIDDFACRDERVRNRDHLISLADVQGFKHGVQC